MGGSTKMFIRGFMIFGGVIFVFVGAAVKNLVPFLVALPFYVIGILIISATLFWLYKDFQKG